jgi:hypothetical protein
MITLNLIALCARFMTGRGRFGLREVLCRRVGVPWRMLGAFCGFEVASATFAGFQRSQKAASRALRLGHATWRGQGGAGEAGGGHEQSGMPQAQCPRCDRSTKNEAMYTKPA